MSTDESQALSEQVLTVLGAAIETIHKKRSATSTDRGQSFVFPGGIDSIQVSIQWAGVTATVAVSGPARKESSEKILLSSHPMTVLRHSDADQRPIYLSASLHPNDPSAPSVPNDNQPHEINLSSHPMTVTRHNDSDLSPLYLSLSTTGTSASQVQNDGKSHEVCLYTS